MSNTETINSIIRLIELEKELSYKAGYLDGLKRADDILTGNEPKSAEEE